MQECYQEPTLKYINSIYTTLEPGETFGEHLGPVSVLKRVKFKMTYLSLEDCQTLPGRLVCCHCDEKKINGCLFPSEFA